MVGDIGCSGTRSDGLAVCGGWYLVFGGWWLLVLVGEWLVALDAVAPEVMGWQFVVTS